MRVITPNATKDTRCKLTKLDVQGLASIIRRCGSEKLCYWEVCQVVFVIRCLLLLNSFIHIWFIFFFGSRIVTDFLFFWSQQTCLAEMTPEMMFGTFGGLLFENFEVSENRSVGDELGADFRNFWG